MEYDLITFIQGLIGSNVKGYILEKPADTPYPAFTVEDTSRRGMDVYGTGKPFDYTHEIQINLIGMKFRQVSQYKDLIIEALDGFSGSLGSTQVIDCRLNEAAPLKTFNKTFQYVLLFTIQTI